MCGVAVSASELRASACAGERERNGLTHGAVLAAGREGRGRWRAGQAGRWA